MLICRNGCGIRIKHAIRALLSILTTFGFAAAVCAQDYGRVDKKLHFQDFTQINSLRGKVLANPSSQLLVRIEYPAALSPRAIATLIQHVRASDPLASRYSNDEIASRIVDGVNKTSFYAARLYRQLARNAGLPAGSVAIAPVTSDNIGTQFFMPPTGQVPAVITIQFSAQRAATGEVSSAADGGVHIYRNTFGEYVTPRALLLTEPAGWPGSQGLVAMWGGNGDRKIYQGGYDVACDPRVCTLAAPSAGDLLENRKFLSILPVKSFAEIKGVLPYPLAVSSPNATTICEIAKIASDNACPHEQVIIALVRQAVSQADPYLATRFQWKAFLARYDPDLAEHWPGAVFDAPRKARLSLIKQIMSAERHALSLASDKSTGAILDGESGAAMLEQLRSEVQFGLAVRQASKANFSLGAILGMGMNLLSAGKSFASGSLSGQVEALQGEMQRLSSDTAVQQSGLAKINEAYTNAQSAFLARTVITGQSGQILGQSLALSTVTELQATLERIYDSQLKPAPTPSLAECRKFANGTDSVNFNGDCDLSKAGDARMGQGLELIIAKEGFLRAHAEHFGSFIVVKSEAVSIKDIEVAPPDPFGLDLKWGLRAHLSFVDISSTPMVLHVVGPNGESFLRKTEKGVEPASDIEIQRLLKSERIWKREVLALIAN